MLHLRESVQRCTGANQRAAMRSVSDSILRCRKGEWFRLQNATTPRLQRFRISGVKLENRCKECPGLPSGVQRFVISGGKLGNRCKIMPVYDLLRAAIPDFRGVNLGITAGFPRKRPRGCSDSGFQVKTCESMQQRKVPPATVVAATRSASDSNFRRRKGD